MIRLLLILIVIAGSLLRYSNISPFKFYPDAYQNLIVAKNIAEYHSVFGPLGQDGLVYPYFLMWTRPIYPLMINGLSWVTQNPIRSAELISLLAGMVGIPIAYLFIRSIFRSSQIGLCGALLIALSFNHTAWGGFIYTETTGVLIMLLVLWRFYARLESSSKWLEGHDLVLGCLLGLGILARYEYVLLIFPILLWTLLYGQTPKVKLANIIMATIFTVSMLLLWLYPISYASYLVFSQLQSFLAIAFICGFVFLIWFSSYIFRSPILQHIKSIAQRVDHKYSKPLGLTILLLVSIALTLQILSPFNLPIETHAMREFFRTDFMLGISTLIGLILFLLKKQYRKYFYLVMIVLVMMVPVYYKINPTMQRYWTHLIPFLLIPASYGLYTVVRFPLLRMRRKELILGISSLILILTVVFGQAFLTWQGIKLWNLGSWHQTSYDEKSARIFGERFLSNDHIIISALPESYFYYTGMSTRSILESDQPPFIALDERYNNRKLYIVEDMGMTDIFPNFSKFLDTKLQGFKVGEYWVGTSYHYSIRTEPEIHPVQVYEITRMDLIEKLNQNHLR
jgi:hypothetical protein